jgi:murein DD-endopeptidase MepM/ murein hydrolase activator NlpD
VVLSLFAAGLAAGGIHAGPPLATTTTTTTTDTTATTTTDVSTTVTSTTPTTTAATTTVATTTAATTTAPAPKPTPKPAGKLLTATPLAPPRCLLVSGFALLQPGRQPLTLGNVAAVPRRPSAADSRVAYPADGSVLTASSVVLSGSGCGTSARARAVVGSVSLFGGAATIRSVDLTVRNGIAGKSAAVTGLTVGKAVVAALPGRPIVIGPWGYVVALAQPDSTQAGALAVHLTKAHAGLAAGTVILIGYAQLPPPKVIPKKVTTAKVATAKVTSTAAPPAHKVAHTKKQARHPTKTQAVKKPKRHVRKHHLGDDPLTVTPPLGLSNYAFPVAGVASYGDTYGGFRGDVPGNWHHGDDIFAALGTPVIAVADGTLNRVGWEHLGGWRLWVRDHNRNQFYYAHLSGYSPLALHSKHVKKGDVIGFIGNSGDAFTTPPHLHFEIHPHQLLKLAYNGAVNPTPYVDGWRHLTKPKAPLPVHPPFPAGAVRREASYIWRELLAARGLTEKAPKPSDRPRIAVAHGDLESSPRQLAAANRREAASPAAGAVRPRALSAPDLLAGIVLPALLFAGALTYRLRRERP